MARAVAHGQRSATAPANAQRVRCLNPKAAPDPDATTIHDFLVPEPWVPDRWPEGLPDGSGEEMTLVHALNETLREEFRHNPDTYIWGQDVAYRDKGGVFNVTKGMQSEFGTARVFNAPIAEDHIMGTADGFSRLSDEIRIVVEGAEFADYFWPGAEQMVEMSHEYWRTRGQFVPNVTVRLPSGGYIGGGLYHSQNIEGWLTTLPGIRIVVPAFADDAAGLMILAALRYRRSVAEKVRPEVPVPGLGTFSARVLIHDNEYAGTWSGGKYPGLRAWFKWFESRTYKMHVRVFLARFRSYDPCATCSGKR
jgi:hypothetical protein